MREGWMKPALGRFFQHQELLACWHGGNDESVAGGGLVNWPRPKLVCRRMSRTPGFGRGEGWPWHMLQLIGHVDICAGIAGVVEVTLEAVYRITVVSTCDQVHSLDYWDALWQSGAPYSEL